LPEADGLATPPPLTATRGPSGKKLPE